MILNFRRMYYRCIADSRMMIILPALPFYFFGLVAGIPAVWLPALAIVFLCLWWGNLCSVRIGKNFLTLPALPGKPHTICQAKQKHAKKLSCEELRRSILQDAQQVARLLPNGSYQTLTHDAVIKRLEQMKGVVIQAKRPVYLDTLRLILLDETGKRCQHCQQKCATWNLPERQFYLVKFKKIYL